MTVISYHSEEGESQVQSDEWQNIAQVTIDIANAGPGDYIIWASCEYAGEYVVEGGNGIVGIRLLLDSTEVNIDHLKPVLPNQFKTFSCMGLKNLTDGFYYLTLQAVCLNLTQTVKVRRKRLLVMKH